MSENILPSGKSTNKTTHNLKLLLPAVILFLALTALQVWRANDQAKPQLLANGVPVNVDIEERFGVRFSGIYIVGRNGLVELTYQVLNVGKAKNFGHYTETSPLLVSEKTGKTVEITIMGLHNHRVEAGRSYYILYRNTDNALQAGDKVTLQIDDLTLAHIPVQ